MKTKLLLFVLLAGTCTLLSAQIIHVPTDYPTIQEGINAASDGDTVLVAENIYYENIRFMGKAITVASEHLLDGDSSHIVNTIIDGSQATDPDSAATVMFIHGEDTTSIINGFTITGGAGVFNMTWQVRAGGGVFSWNAGCKIVDNIITDNHIEDIDKAGGVGIFCGVNMGNHWAVIRNNYIGYNTSLAHGLTAFGGGVSVTTSCIIENNIIEYNTCTNTDEEADGGGIELEATAVGNLIAYVKSNIIQNNVLNSNTGSFGAGIRTWGVKAVINDNIISDNTIDAQANALGGGVYARNIPDGIEMRNNLIERNVCTGYNIRGCGAYLNACGETIIENNEINQNISDASNTTSGAGIWIVNATDTVFIDQNTFVSNRADGSNYGAFGGAIGIQSIVFDVVYINSNKIINNYSRYGGGGLWAIETYRMYASNNLFKGNEADSIGGAIGLYEPQNKFKPDDVFHPIIANNNFINNISKSGGAIYSGYDQGVPIIFNSIFWDNSANSGQDLYNSSDLDMFVYNNDIDTTKIYTPFLGKDNIYVDPKFIDDSYHLSWSSYCANAGIDSLDVDGVWYISAATDIDGDARPYLNTKPDIGVDEAPILHVGIDANKKPENHTFQIYPNPFSISTIIEYVLRQPEQVTLMIYDHMGKQVYQKQENQSLGKQQLIWNAESHTDGIYHYRLQAGEHIVIGKMVKVR